MVVDVLFEVLSRLVGTTYWMILAIVAALAMIFYIVKAYGEGVVEKTDAAVPRLLQVIAARLEEGKGIEQAFVEAIEESKTPVRKLYNKTRESSGEGISFRELLDGMRANTKSTNLRLALGVLTTGEAGGVRPDVLKMLADDMDTIRRLVRARRQRSRGMAITALVISSLLMPALIGLTLNFFNKFQAAPEIVTITIRAMVIITALAATLFAGILQARIQRYLLLAPLITLIAITLLAITEALTI
ncbi:MAG: type II secretion system F family protein [Aigarchaeota archaeon]|nr:type II secretion system F family protein [Candidatus Pelearchaeum maunauluense]